MRGGAGDSFGTRAVAFLLFLAEGFGLGLFAGLCLHGVKAIDSLHCIIIEGRDFGAVPAALSIAFGIWAMLSLRFWLGAVRERLGAMALPVAAAPLLLCLPLSIFLELSYLCPLVLVFLVAVSVARVSSLFMRPDPPKAKPGNAAGFPWAPTTLWAVFALFVAAGSVAQVKLFNSLYLPVADWGNYIDIALNSLNGRFFWSDTMGRSLLSEHLEPAALAFLCAFVWAFPSTSAFFVMNAAVVALPAPLLYMLCRRLGLSRSVSALLPALYLLNPACSSMVLSLYYGFHESFLAMPLIALYFVLLANGRWRWAFAVFLLSLGVKETVAVFWGCLGLVHILQGRRRFGGAMLAISAVFFLVAVKLVLPHFAQDGVYAFANRFGGVGGSISELALAPILKPGAFWGELLKFENVCMLSCLFIPVTLVLSRMPLLAFSGAGILLFVCLKSDKGLGSVNSWYLAEPLVAAYVGAAYALAAKRGAWSGLWRRLLYAGLPTGPGAAVNGALAGSFAASLLAFYVWSPFLPFGMNFMGRNLLADSRVWIVDELKAKIPPGAGLTASDRLAPHFLFRNAVSTCSEPPREWVAMDLADILTDTVPWETFRRRMLLSGSYKEVYISFSRGNAVVVFRAGANGGLPDGMRKIDGASWSSFGEAVDTGDPGFAARVMASGSKAVFLVRALGNPGCDAIVKAGATPGQAYTTPFGNGARPAYMSGADEAFSFELPIQAGMEFKPFIAIERKPPPDFSAEPFTQPLSKGP